MRKVCLVLALAFGLQWGCAGTKKVIESQVAEPTPIPTVAPVPGYEKPQAVKEVPEDYQVVKGDSLWKISGQVYKDSLKWVLIFKANRSTVKDPDLIYPRQVLVIERGHTVGEVLGAMDKAEKTPKYKPHTRPRDVLPINYF